jgi:hypothetical protein
LLLEINEKAWSRDVAVTKIEKSQTKRESRKVQENNITQNMKEASARNRHSQM